LDQKPGGVRLDVVDEKKKKNPTGRGVERKKERDGKAFVQFSCLLALATCRPTTETWGHTQGT
jgi:hypothetical protein